VADADSICRQVDPNAGGREAGSGAREIAGLGSAWHGASWIIGHDGKARRVEPGIRLLAHGVSARVGRLRAYGNAIAPPLAAEVIGAYLDCMPVTA
jgi:DNA (cytosine-5)-methyltransferase 1